MTKEAEFAGRAFRGGATEPIENFWEQFSYNEVLPIIVNDPPIDRQTEKATEGKGKQYA